jgi:DNA-binding response OmpR family regulator
VVATHDRYADAVATLEREKIDLILSDIRLAGERSGIDVAQYAREKNVPVLFSTGMEPAEARDLAVGCLMKPYSERTLKAALEAIDQHLQGGKVKPVKGLILYG